MDGEGLPRDGSQTVLAIVADHGWTSPALALTVRASFSQLQLSFFEESLARKLRFHIFNFPFLREV